MTALHHPYASAVNWQTRAKEYLYFFLLFVTPVKRSIRLLYEMDSTHNLFTERTLYRNMGYWKDRPGTLDEACQAMARLLGERAQFSAEDCILDVGFGFGEQDFFWAERFAPRRIVGLNIIDSQVEIARQLAARRGLQDRVDFRHGSATDMPFDAGSFDKVVALEAAFQFVTRGKFFDEAYRVLRAGGRIATVEPLPSPGAKHKWLDDYLQRSLVAIPKENLYSRDVYVKKLEEAGFENVQVTSIRESVYLPFMSYLRGRIKEDEIVQRVNPLIRGLWQGWLSNFDGGRNKQSSEDHDYIVAVADKPRS